MIRGKLSGIQVCCRRTEEEWGIKWFFTTVSTASRARGQISKIINSRRFHINWRLCNGKSKVLRTSLDHRFTDKLPQSNENWLEAIKKQRILEINKKNLSTLNSNLIKKNWMTKLWLFLSFLSVSEQHTSEKENQFCPTAASCFTIKNYISMKIFY